MRDVRSTEERLDSFEGRVQVEVGTRKVDSSRKDFLESEFASLEAGSGLDSDVVGEPSRGVEYGVRKRSMRDPMSKSSSEAQEADRREGEVDERGKSFVLTRRRGCWLCKFLLSAFLSAMSCCAVWA